MNLIDLEKILTKEKQFIEVDTTSRWRISDILKFYQSLVTYEAAFSRLSDIVDSSVSEDKACKFYLTKYSRFEPRLKKYVN